MVWGRNANVTGRCGERSNIRTIEESFAARDDVNFVMSNDPVSTGASYGYLRGRSDDLTGPGTQTANRGFASKIKYGLTKKENKEIIFYQTPNLNKLRYLAPTNIHQYT